MRPTQKRYAELRAKSVGVSMAKLPDSDLYAVGFEQGYACDVRTKDAYMPRREPTYVLAFAAGRRQKAVDVSVQLQDPFSYESRLRAAEARVGAQIIRAGLQRFAAAIASGDQTCWSVMKYVAPMKGSSMATVIYDHARNRLSGHFTPYLRIGRVEGIDSPEVLPADAVAWPIYRVAVGAQS